MYMMTMAKPQHPTDPRAIRPTDGSLCSFLIKPYNHLRQAFSGRADSSTQETASRLTQTPDQPHRAPASDLNDDEFLDGLAKSGETPVVGPVELQSRISKGGMGIVYRGRHVKLDIDVAVKFLFPHLAEDNHEYVVRFEREARLAAQLNNENLVRVFDADSERSYHYVVMELVCGETARDRVARKGPLGEAEAVEIIRGATRGLEAAHRKGIVHRDIKPENIMIDGTGVVKLADLGIAKMADDSGPAGGLTQPGFVMGTPSFMPPEQFTDAHAVSFASDIYSMGATLYFLLTGEQPYSGTIYQIVQEISRRDFPNVRAACPRVSPKLAAILDRCTCRDPTERYADATELLRELERSGTGRLSLADADTGTVTAVAKVSTPPARRVGEIRMEMTGDDAAGTVRAGAASAGSRRASGTVARHNRRGVLTVLGLGLMCGVFAIGFYYAVAAGGHRHPEQHADGSPDGAQASTVGGTDSPGEPGRAELSTPHVVVPQVRSGPVEPDPAHTPLPQPVEPNPVPLEPVQPESVEPEPVEPEPQQAMARDTNVGVVKNASARTTPERSPPPPPPIVKEAPSEPEPVAVRADRRRLLRRAEDLIRDGHTGFALNIFRSAGDWGGLSAEASALHLRALLLAKQSRRNEARLLLQKLCGKEGHGTAGSECDLAYQELAAMTATISTRASFGTWSQWIELVERAGEPPASLSVARSKYELARHRLFAGYLSALTRDAGRARSDEDLQRAGERLDVADRLIEQESIAGAFPAEIAALRAEREAFEKLRTEIVEWQRLDGEVNPVGRRLRENSSDELAAQIERIAGYRAKHPGGARDGEAKRQEGRRRRELDRRSLQK